MQKIQPLPKYLLIPLLIALAASCQSEPREKPAPSVTKLRPTELIQNPQTAKVEPDAPADPLPVIEFVDTDIEYGTIIEGDTMRYGFDFENTGDANLIITKVKPACGCTEGSWPKEPIPPGGTGTVVVEFKTAGWSGRQEKSAAVFTNANPSKIRLYFRGSVIPKDKSK